MQRFGLNGRSLVALTSSGACAIPAIMSTRTIANPKERLITILVSPLISCSARIPVYAILIGFAVPAVTVWGVFNAQALAFMGIYLISILAALLSALVFKYVLKSQEQSFLMIELPEYRVPVWRNVFITVWTKTKAFLFGAGKIIIGISMVLWFLASFGPGDSMRLAESEVIETSVAIDEQELADRVANARLEASYAGRIGKTIEPVIKPLGYDWKIGIALVTSFAAREVFVGTIATLYAIGSADENESLITERMSEARRPDGTRVYNTATAVSLILFYLFAMQCMSTLAVTKRETGTWKWPLVQTVYMTGLAYFAAFAAYQLLS
jgi:ferrous iron transport protein B